MPVSCISETAARPVCSVLVSIFQKVQTYTDTVDLFGIWVISHCMFFI